jgi:hypothetical protein
MEETSPPRATQSFIDEAIAVSAQETGFHIICGDDLDSETATSKAISIVASSGVLLIQNIQNFPEIRLP